MNILIFSKHFWPDNFKINIVAKELVKRGHKITVLTSDTRYYFLNKKNNYKKKFLNKKIWHGVNIFYLPVYKKKNYSWIHIFFYYFTHLISTFFYCHFFLKKKYDLILVFATTPIFQAIPAIYFSKLIKKPLFLWVQDLWPESLRDTGYIKNQYFLFILKFLVNIIYSLSSVILVQSDGFKKNIISNFKLNKKILTYYNLSELKFQKFINKKNKKLLIIYAGNFGQAQDFNTLLKVVNIKKIQSNFYFKLIGSGKKFNLIKEYIVKNNLSKYVVLKNYLDSKKLYPEILKSDALFITLKKGNALDETIPGKFQTYLSFGKPIIANCGGITKNIIKKYNIGFANLPGHHINLANNLIKLSRLKLYDKIQIYKKSKILYKKYFEIKNNINYLEMIFEKSLKNNVKKNLL